MPIEWIVAIRFLREGRMQTLLILAGVMIGVAVIIAITALITGLQGSLISRTLGTQPHIVLRPPEDLATPVYARDGRAISARVEKRAQRLRSIDQWQRIHAEVDAVPGVVASSIMVTGPAFAARGTASRAVTIIGIDPERYARIVKVGENMVAGEYRVSAGNVLIGIDLAADLGVAVGDKLRIATALNRDDSLTVAGLFDMGNREINRRWALTTLSAARNLLDLPGGVSNIDLAVDDIFGAERIARDIAASTGLKAESWMESNAQLLAAFENQTMTTRAIRSFVTLIVALGIASVLVVSVVQKQKEIGILRAMGTPHGTVMWIFLIQGGLVGFVGALLGAGLGAGLVAALSRLVTDAQGNAIFTPENDPMVYVTAVLLAGVVGLLAAALPARRAAKMDPVAAIRG
ncbi:MAG: ABC transporter permease [Burkholderiales bacterium]